MFTSMLDQQLTTNLTNKGLGLADILVRQLSKTGQNMADSMENVLQDLPAFQQNKNTKSTLHSAVNSEKMALKSSPQISKPAMPTINKQAETSLGSKVTNFIGSMIDHATVASKLTGLPANLMLGQAALETGWGKRQINGQNGEPSYNLFGIKATGNWKGKVVEATTTEYINGVKQKRIEKFRAYDSFTESFQDFANLIKNNPRYQQVVDNVNSIEKYANAMQKAGYATDPHYAKKLASVIEKVTGL
jgi:peptidoglycan hydrolase FlgJ